MKNGSYLSVNVKANKNNKRNNVWWLYLAQIFVRSTLPSKLEIQCKKGIYFLFDFGWYSKQKKKKEGGLLEDMEFPGIGIQKK